MAKKKARHYDKRFDFNESLLQKSNPTPALPEEQAIARVRESVVYLATGLLIICGELQVNKLSDEDKGRFEEICDLTLKNILKIFSSYRSPSEVQEAERAAVERVIKDIETEGAITFLDSHSFQNKKLWAIPYEKWLSLKSSLGEQGNPKINKEGE